MMHVRLNGFILGRHGIAVVLAVLVAAPILAQTLPPSRRDLDPYRSPWRQATRPVWSAAEFRAILDSIDALRDDAARRDLLIVFHEEYLREFDRESREIRVVAEQFLSRWEIVRTPRSRFESHELFRGERRSEEDLTPYQVLLGEWQIRRSEIDEKFLSSCAAVFEDDELPQWQALARDRRYEASIAQMRGPWRASFFVTNLTKLLDEMELSPDESSQIRSAVEAYEAELDDMMLQVCSELLQLDLEWHKLGVRVTREGGNDADRQRWQETAAAQQEILNGLQRRTLHHRDLIRNALPPQRRAEFMWKCGQALHPSIYGSGPADLAIHGLLYETLLEAARASQVKSVADWYHAQIGPVYERIARGTERRMLNGWNADPESARWAEESRMFRERAQADPSSFHIYEPPTIDLWRRRLDLHEQTCQRLRSLFTPAEFEQLPAAVRMVLSVGGR